MGAQTVRRFIKSGFSSRLNQFHCPHCVIIQQSEDISALSATVSVISRDIKALQEKLANITYNGLQYAKSTPEVSLQPSAPGPNKPRLFCLGKYNGNNAKPRLILVKFNNTSIVNMILE